MKALVLAAGAVMITVALPASAAIMTIGGSYAEGCYHAAEARSATPENLNSCDRAFTEQALTAEDRLATHVNRGILKMIRKDYGPAESDFQAAIAMNPGVSEPWLNMAILQLNQGRSAQSLPLFDKALQLGTRRPEIAYYGRAIANEDLGNVKAAYSDLRHVVSLKPEWSDPKVDLARYQVRPR